MFGFGSVSDLTLLSKCSELPEELLKYKTGCCSGGGWDLAVVANDTDLSDALRVCNTSTVVPVDLVHGDVGGDEYEELLTRGFMLNWKAGDCSVCENSGGRCGFELSSIFGCWICHFPNYSRCFIWRSALSRLVVWRKKENYHNVENFLNSYGTLAPKRYSYSDLKKITNSFLVKLSQGGYGCVYKGKLPNGSLVAVKVLNESKGGEEFINEVASISRTSHVNVVTFLGFCFEGHKIALIYEFRPHGSLEKFLYKESSSGDHQLGWERLSQFAIGIARGLDYLHRGCNTRILHFDIKPHNILLDEVFCPKISDYGLAKLCPRKQSVVSMLNARGTVGYIAPEVFCRNFGGVSHKSDVYSYGMMVLEMVGGRNKIKPDVDGSTEMYFPDWIYNRLELDELGAHNGITSEAENEMARKMVIVSLWCIQIVPSSRPSMSRVVEMLEGSIQSLQIPPKPVLSSPPRSREDSSAMESSSMAIL
ncbi:hypothetical protein RJ639_040683 [Escallonia herrerae]|uniref:Protein kinase domain-containing protein n=1 Tax=Escallonia herrerae TaxID=1293975 RepID=A0AA89BBJ4_9ASTE|nr:hypothetical protein RJ639_040683 [Escallonia herrerae]